MPGCQRDFDLRRARCCVTAPACRAPQGCPVPDVVDIDLRRLRLAYLEPGRLLHRVHNKDYPATTFNPSGAGEGRFSPLPGHAHTYAGDTATVALLEMVFHNVHWSTARVVYAATDLAGYALTRVRVERRLPVVDLRDPALDLLGLNRGQLTATTAAHYPCTRQWAQRLVGRSIGGISTVGLLWNSRVAELAAADSLLLGDLLDSTAAEACVLYGDGGDPMLSDAGSGFADLVGPSQGRLLVDQIAEQLNAVVV